MKTTAKLIKNNTTVLHQNIGNDTNLLLDVVRHLFCVAVIILHMSSTSRYTLATNEWIREIGSWVDGAVFGFFAISGFLFVAPSVWMQFFKKQARRLLIPFVLFSLIYSLFLMLLGKQSFSQGIYATVILHGAGMQLYYLPLLFFITLIYSVFTIIDIKLNLVSQSLMVAVLILFSVALGGQGSTGSDPNNYGLYTAAFVLGRILFLLKKERLVYWWVLIFFGGLIGLGLAYDERLIDLALAFLLVGGSVIFPVKLPPMRLPGSGGVYLLHTPIANFAVSVCLLYMGIDQYLNVILSVVITYILCLIFIVKLNLLFPKHRWMWLE